MADMGAASFDADGGLKVHQTNGSGGGGGASTIADGADVNAGATTNTAVTGDNTGTISAKLRGLNKAIADFWDSTNHWLQVKVMNGNANGPALMANSAPVVPASDYIGPVNITKILGIALSSTNPLIIQQQLVAAGLAAQVYHISTGILVGTSGQAGLSIFNANKNKTIIFLSLQAFNSTSGQSTRLYWIPTTDPAFGTPQTPYNAYAGGAASAIAGNCSSAAGGLTVPGSGILRSGNVASSSAYEFLANGIPEILPPNANNGIAMYINGATSDKIGFSATYIEY